MVFIGHLMIVLVFIIGFYLGVTYSNLKLEIEEINNTQVKLDSILAARVKLEAQISILKQASPERSTQAEIAQLNAQHTAIDQHLAYTKNLYNRAVLDYLQHKKSIFAVQVLKKFKKLDQQFAVMA